MWTMYGTFLYLNTVKAVNFLYWNLVLSEYDVFLGKVERASNLTRGVILPINRKLWKHGFSSCFVKDWDEWTVAVLFKWEVLVVVGNVWWFSFRLRIFQVRDWQIQSANQRRSAAIQRILISGWNGNFKVPMTFERKIILGIVVALRRMYN